MVWMLIKRPQRRPMMVMILLRKAESSAASLAPHIVTTLSVAGERHEAEMPKAELPKAELPLQPAQPGPTTLQALRAGSPVLSLLGYHISKTDDKTEVKWPACTAHKYNCL